MKDIEIYLYYENGSHKCEDFFSLGNRRVDDLNALKLDEEKFTKFTDALIEVSPAPIYFDTIPGGRNGCYGFAINEIYISWCISPAMQIRTAIHEMAHASLHSWPDGVKPADVLPRAVQGTEAEGVAYLVCQHYGLDTSSYSIGYIRSWIRHLTDDEAEKSVEKIQEAADKLVAAIDAELEKQLGKC